MNTHNQSPQDPFSNESSAKELGVDQPPVSHHGGAPVAHFEPAAATEPVGSVMSDVVNEQQHAPLQNNPYMQAQQQDISALESSAPNLASSVSQGINKKAIAFLVGVGLIIALLTAFAISRYYSAQDEKEALRKQQEETRAVSIPEAPNLAGGLEPDAKPIEVMPTTTTPVIDIVRSEPVKEPAAVVVQSAPDVPLLDPLVELRKQSNLQPPTADDKSSDPDGGSVARGSVSNLYARDQTLVRGTYIRCVLETRIVTDVPGFASCVTTEPVYSFSGKKLLLPRGSKVSGEYNANSPTGPRIGLIWNRILTPTGYDVRIQSPSVDNLGGAGIAGDFKTHFWSRMGSAVMISLISDVFKYAAAEYGPSSTVSTSTSTSTNPYESSTAKTIENVAKDQIARLAMRPNTVTVNQGTVINIYAARDIDFSNVIKN